MSKNRHISLADYILHGIYFSIYGIVKYFPSPIGDVFRYLITKPFIKKMKRVRIYEGVTFWYPYRIEMGRHVTLNEWVYLNGFGGIQIGNGVRIGHRTSILSSDHNFTDVDSYIYQQGVTPLETRIEDDVYIGCNVTILGGVIIGKGAVVAAGAVVTSHVGEYEIVAGVPAKKIRDRVVSSVTN